MRTRYGKMTAIISTFVLLAAGGFLVWEGEEEASPVQSPMRNSRISVDESGKGPVVTLEREGKVVFRYAFDAPQHLYAVEESPSGHYLLVWHMERSPRRLKIFRIADGAMTADFVPGYGGGMQWTFGDRIFHIHLKDAKIDLDRLNDVGIMAAPLEYHTPKLPGLGDVRWGDFFSKLTSIGYGGDVVVEVEDRAYETSLETRIGAIRQVGRYVKQYLP